MSAYLSTAFSVVIRSSFVIQVHLVRVINYHSTLNTFQLSERLHYLTEMFPLSVPFFHQLIILDIHFLHFVFQNIIVTHVRHQQY